MIPVDRKDDKDVLAYYDSLRYEVDLAIDTGYIRLCNDWENWNGRRCDGFCEVTEDCKEMSAQKQEKWIK